MKLILAFIIFISTVSASDKVLASCINNKSELIDLKKETTKGYEKDSLEIDIVVRGEKVFVSSSTGEAELIYLGGNNPQFIEKVLSGHNVLYTYFPDSKILTMQKSYDFFGPIMVNAYLQCK